MYSYDEKTVLCTTDYCNDPGFINAEIDPEHSISARRLRVRDLLPVVSLHYFEMP